VIYERRHTRMIADFGGLSKQLPIYATLFMIMMLSSIGLPALNGFIGEFTILLGAWHIPTGFSVAIPFTSKALAFSPKVWVVCAVFGIVLGAAYMLWLYQRTMFGKLDKPENQALKDLNFRESMTLIPLVVLAFWIGIFPETFLGMLRPTVHRLVEQVTSTEGRTASAARNSAGLSGAPRVRKAAMPSPSESSHD
jgi:NADH-quinone oxidoreductase subunit M